jgi:DNA-binding GntR family transcriptional regulator
VLNHRLTPGTKLPEPELCNLFGVGRAVVRRVLEKLAHDGIVALRPNKGAVIAEPTPEETSQIFEARRAMERVLVELAVARVTEADLRDLRRQLADEHDAMHRFDQPSWARLASGFHLRIAALARNPVLQRYLTELVSRCSLIVGCTSRRAMRRASTTSMRPSSPASRRARPGAVALMEAHLRELEQRIETSRMQGEKSLAQMLGLGAGLNKEHHGNRFQRDHRVSALQAHGQPDRAAPDRAGDHARPRRHRQRGAVLDVQHAGRGAADRDDQREPPGRRRAQGHGRQYRAHREFVVHLSDEAMAEKMHRCGERLPPDVSELAHVG